MMENGWGGLPVRVFDVAEFDLVWVGFGPEEQEQEAYCGAFLC
jgi:hypothetical protein